MDPALVTMAVQALSGAAGGNVIGAVAKNLSLGGLGNTLAGALGGGLGSALLSNVLNLPGIDTAAVDPMAILGQVAQGGGAGAAATLLIGILRGLFSK
jgi:hypothetical protein